MMTVHNPAMKTKRYFYIFSLWILHTWGGSNQLSTKFLLRRFNFRSGEKKKNRVEKLFRKYFSLRKMPFIKSRFEFFQRIPNK